MTQLPCYPKECTVAFGIAWLSLSVLLMSDNAGITRHLEPKMVYVKPEVEINFEPKEMALQFVWQRERLSVAS
jgi:translation elongation factor EF-1beta